MSGFLPLSEDAMLGRGTRVRADYVLVDPPEAFLSPGEWTKERAILTGALPGDHPGVLPSQLQSWAAVMSARPALAFVSARRITGQVVRVEVIATRAARAGLALPGHAVIPGFEGPLNRGIDRTYRRTIMQLAGDASLEDIELAIETGRRTARQENPLAEAAEEVAAGARTVAAGLPWALIVAAGLAVFLATRHTL